MKKEVIVAGLLGGTVLLAWLFLTNAALPLKANLIHERLPLSSQLEVHEVLAQNIPEAGTYSVPYLSRQEEDLFPDYRSQPVYSITYEGYSHDGRGGGGVLTSFPVVVLAVFLPPLIAAWMLSMASPAIRSRYWRRFLFVAALGVIIVLYDEVLQMSFGPQPKDYLTFLAVNNLIAWALVSLVVARRLKPASP